MPPHIKEQVVVVPEIESIGLGGAIMAGCRTCLVVSMGTGSAMVRVDHQTVTHSALLPPSAPCTQAVVTVSLPWAKSPRTNTFGRH